ncbi:hypothetical protein OF846_000110 [Rhodotorula toruloides]|nr:hypothetical protein OF846_000110 [Rhodotorula toruloides]
MLRRRLGAILLFALLLLVDDARCDSDGLPVTAPTSLQPGKQATFGWDEGTPPYRVRVLINTHQDTESKGLTTTRFMWFAKETKVGDQVQFWVYDSKGAEGKSPNIPIVAAASASKSASGGGGRASSTTHDASGKSPKASGGATVGGGGSASAKETGKAGSSTGSVKTAAPRGSAPASKDTEASNDLDTPLNTAAATMSTSAPIAPADTATVATTPVTTPAAAPVAPASAPTASSTSSLFSGDNTALYLGIGGVALALILVVALLLYVPFTYLSSRRKT